jgi:hypothetical protein
MTQRGVALTIPGKRACTCLNRRITPAKEPVPFPVRGLRAIHGKGNAYFMIAAKSQMLISGHHEIGYNRKEHLLASRVVKGFCVFHHRTYRRKIEKWFTALKFKGDPGVW